MTLGAWGLYAAIAGTIMFLSFLIGCNVNGKGSIQWMLLIGGIASGIVLFGMIMWYQNTESGRRALKSQELNFNGGIERTVEVYDATGNLIKRYSGKFDVDYDDDRIIFDDENDKRHVIYYPTGTIVIDEN